MSNTLREKAFKLVYSIASDIVIAWKDERQDVADPARDRAVERIDRALAEEREKALDAALECFTKPTPDGWVFVPIDEAQKRIRALKEQK